jgi:hypothetical protein
VAPPAPPKAPSSSYETPPQDPTSSYGAPQAPPLEAPPSYNPPQEPPREEPRPVVVQQVVPQGFTLSVFPLQQQQASDPGKPSYDSPSISAAR